MLLTHKRKRNDPREGGPRINTVSNPTPHLNALRVLLLEDDVSDFVAIRNALEKRRITSRISLYDDPEDALKSLVAAPDRFDLIIIDHHVAGDTGLRFCRALFETRIALPRFFLTRSEALGLQLQKMRFIEDYLVKDPDREYLKVLPLLISQVMYKAAERQARRDHVRAMQALEKRFRTVLSHVADGILIVSREGIIKLANPAARRILSGLYGNPVGAPFPYAVVPGTTTEIAVPKSPTGSVTAEMRVTSVDWGGQTAALASLRDISDRKQMEQALRTANQLRDRIISELKKANRKILEQQKAVIEEERLKMLLQMAGVTVKELDEPLSVLLESIVQLGAQGEDPEARDVLMDQIQTTGRRLAGLIRQIRMLPYEGNAPSARTGHPSRPLEQPLTLLIGEPAEDDFDTIRKLFAAYSRVSLLRAVTIAEAVAKAAEGKVDLILSEYQYPDGAADDFIQRLQAQGLIIPVMVITGQGDEVIASRIIQAGAYDYIPKHRLKESVLIEAVWKTLDKARLQKEVRTAQKQITRMTMVDELTGLYNRRHFDDCLNREFARARRSGADLVLCMCDLDHFKSINDRYGHIAGDKVLAGFGQLVRDLVRQSDIGCRYGGEEFAIIIPDTDLESAGHIAERLRKAVEDRPFRHPPHRIPATVSIGLAGLKGSRAASPEALVARADEALYVAKEEGRNRVVAFPISTEPDPPPVMP